MKKITNCLYKYVVPEEFFESEKPPEEELITFIACGSTVCGCQKKWWTSATVLDRGQRTTGPSAQDPDPELIYVTQAQLRISANLHQHV